MVKRRRQTAEEQYHVEVIEKARVTDDGDWEYYVKWGGYTSDENSWEPTANVKDCKRLLRSFWENVGLDDGDYPPGYTIEPTKEWIAQEREFFREAFGNKAAKKKKHDRETSASASMSPVPGPSSSAITNKPIAGKATKHKAKPRKPGWEWVPRSDDDEPAVIRAQKTGKKRQSSVISLSSSDSDLPISISAAAKLKIAKATEKGKGKVKSTTPTVSSKKSSAEPGPSKSTVIEVDDSSQHSDHDSLFSEVSSPITHKAALPPPKSDARAPSTSKTAAPKLSIKVPPPAGQVITTIDTPQSANSVSTPLTASANTPRVPAHRDRQNHPRVQMIPMQLVDKSGTSSITTKQKIAEKSGHTTTKTMNTSKSSHDAPAGTGSTVTTPAVPPQAQPTSTVDLFPPQKSLAKMSFKKKSTATVASPAVPSPSVAKTPQQPSGSSYFPDKEAVNSPVSAGADWGNNDSAWGGGWGGGWGDGAGESGGGWGEPSSRLTSTSVSGRGQSPMLLTSETAPITRRAAPVIPRQTSAQLPPTPVPKQPTEVDLFLGSIMPDELAAPMDESAPEEPLRPAPSVASAVAKKVPVFNLNIAKKWSWHGELYIEAGPDRAHRMCNVTLSDPTDARPMGLKLNILYTSEVSVLRCKKLFDMTDIYSILSACAPLQQCCKVSHATEADFEAMTALSAFMTRKSQFTYADVYLDNDAVGLLIVFPSAITEVCNLFRVPAYLRDQSSLLAALVPWDLSPNEMVEHMWTPRTDHIPYKCELEPELLRVLEAQGKIYDLAKKPRWATALRLLKVTAEMYNFFTRSPRMYCMWHENPKTKRDTSDLDNRLLLAFLDECHAKNVGHKASVRVVFVHVGALETVRKLSGFATRRCKNPEVRIYTYGAHASVPPERWGLREIYPLGGIVTLTVSALKDDAFGVYGLIKLVEDHPFWMCYVHPYVLAALFRRDHPHADPATVLERGEFLYTELLDLIEDGCLSLLYAPPLSRSPCLEKNRTDAYADPRVRWAEWVLNQQFSERSEILEMCVKMLETAFPKVSDRELAGVVEKEVFADLRRMQLQPSLMDNYRRYVAITEPRSETDVEGIELASVDKFEFRDDWHLPR